MNSLIRRSIQKGLLHYIQISVATPESQHYIRPFGGRKILYIWEQIELDMGVMFHTDSLAIPLAKWLLNVI